MIHEINLDNTDLLITHFRNLFEINNKKKPFASNHHHVLPIISSINHTNLPWYVAKSKYLIDDDLLICIQYVKDLVTRYEFEYDADKQTYVELHYGNAKDKQISNPFDIHSDDYNLINSKVITLIIYLDVKCIRGELVFYNRCDTDCWYWLGESFEPFKVIDINNPNISSCKGVIFDGSIYHKPNNYSKGHRLSVVFTIPKKE